MSNVNIIGARKAAKIVARTQGITHQQALDRIATERGFSHWGDMLAAAGPAKPSGEPSLDALLKLAMSIGATSVHVEQIAAGEDISEMRSRVFMRIDGVRQLVHDSGGFMSLRLGGLILERAGMPRKGSGAASGVLKLCSGLEVGVAKVSFDLDEMRADRVSSVVLRLPWSHPAVAVDELGVRHGDGWDVAMSASSGLVVVGGKTNTMKTTMAHLMVEERRRRGLDTLLVDDIRDHDGLLAAIHSSHGRAVIVVLHAAGTGDVLARLSALAGPEALRHAFVAAVIGSRRVPRECASCAGAGCPLCEGTGVLGSGVLMVARKISGAADLISRASVVDRGDDLPEILRLPAAMDPAENVRSVDVRASTLVEIDRMLVRMGRDMLKAAERGARSPALTQPQEVS